MSYWAGILLLVLIGFYLATRLVFYAWWKTKDDFNKKKEVENEKN